MFRVQHRKHGNWLQSPHKFEDGDEFWLWSKDERDAHEFKTRKEAKDTLRRIQPNGLSEYKLLGLKGM